MKEQDPIIDHFQLMTNVVKYLRSIDGEMWVAEYQYPGGFESWLLIIRLKGERYRVLYDGRDKRLVLETESDTPISSYFPTHWAERATAEVSDPRGALFERQIQGLLEIIPSLK